MSGELNLQKVALRRPYILRSGKPNKYNKTSLDEHRTLSSGAIIARTLNVPENYDELQINAYKAFLESQKVEKEVKSEEVASESAVVEESVKKTRKRGSKKDATTSK